jgi:hypothetical protein
VPIHGKEQLLEELTRRITAQIQPESIILFGSVARVLIMLIPTLIYWWFGMKKIRYLIESEA